MSVGYNSWGSETRCQVPTANQIESCRGFCWGGTRRRGASPPLGCSSRASAPDSCAEAWPPAQSRSSSPRALAGRSSTTSSPRSPAHPAECPDRPNHTRSIVQFRHGKLIGEWMLMFQVECTLLCRPAQTRLPRAYFLQRSCQWQPLECSDRTAETLSFPCLFHPHSLLTKTNGI